MNSAIERLISLRVRDVMNSDVVTVEDRMTLAQAAELFERYDVTGAPVVNKTGQCVGVLSVSDFARHEKERANSAESFGFGIEQLVVKKTGSTLQLETCRDDYVADHMSPFVQTIHIDAPIMNAARVLVGEHIHRLVIVDEDLKPIGILSSLDLVATMIAAVEE